MESRAAVRTQGWKGRVQDGDGREENEYLLVYTRERGRRLRRRGGHDGCGGLGKHGGSDDGRNNGDGGRDGGDGGCYGEHDGCGRDGPPRAEFVSGALVLSSSPRD